MDKMAPNAVATTSAMRMTAVATEASSPPTVPVPPLPPSEKKEVEQEDLLCSLLPFVDGDVDVDGIDASVAPSIIFPSSPYSSASQTYVSDYSSHSHSYNQSSFVVNDTPSPTSSSTTLTIEEEELLLTEPIGAVDFTEHELEESTPATTSIADSPTGPPSQPLLLPECGISGGRIYHRQQCPLGPPLPLPRVDGVGGSTHSGTTISSLHQQAQAATCSPVPGLGPVPFLTMDELFRKVRQDRLKLQQQQQQNQQPTQQMRMISYPTSSDEGMSSSFSNLQDSPAKMVAIWENDGQKKDTEPNLSALISSNAEQQHQELFRRSSTASASSSISTKSSTSSSSSPVLVDSPSHERRQQRQQRRQQQRHPQQPHTPKFRDYQTEQWFERYEELVKFYEGRGHSSVPHTDTSNKCLARWVKRQRYQYKLRQDGKPSAMTDERIKLLESLEFVWDSHSSAWEDRLRDLEDFKSIHKHCNVPSNYRRNITLASWIKCQRRQYRLFHEGKKSNMTPGRIERLERIGFRFNVRDD